MSIADETARAWVEVDRPAILANARTIAAISGRRLLPMVKANAYGLGAVPVALALEALDPWGFGVATPEEGAELRAAGIRRPIVVFSPLQLPEIERMLAHDLRPSIGDLDALAAWSAKSDRPFHAGIDTGMGRSGFVWHEAATWADALAGARGLEGVFTHFHSAEADVASVERQWNRLQECLAPLPVRPQLVHAANSAAALRGRAFGGDLVRPGIFLYGGEAYGPRPASVARFRARVVAVRRVLRGESVSYGATWTASNQTSVATIGVGYADGLHRTLGNRGMMELGGARVPILGRVTMDMTMVAPAGECAVGDVATVFGGLVSLDEQAALAGTISYELLTALGARVPRYYL